MFCKDRWVQNLLQSGYNPVLLPRSDILPLQVVASRFGRRSLLGSIADLFTSSVAAPTATPGDIVGIDLDESSAFRTVVGFKILERMLPSFHVNVPELKAAYSDARKVQFSVERPKSKKVSLTDVSRYLAGADVIEAGPLVEHFFLSGDYRLHLITEVLQTKAFSIRATDAREAEMDVDLNLAAGALSGGTQVRRESEASLALIYEGTREITFAFRAIEIGLDGGRWAFKGQSPHMHLGDARTPEPEPRSELLEPDGFVAFDAE